MELLPYVSFVNAILHIKRAHPLRVHVKDDDIGISDPCAAM